MTLICKFCLMSFSKPSRKLKSGLISILLFVSSSALAQDMLYIPGSVPLEHTRRPAIDIVYRGEKKTPDELVILRDKQGVDLSDLMPDETSELWRNEIGRPLNPEDDKLDLNANQEVQYISDTPEITGRYRFSVKQTDKDGQPQLYRLLVSKDAHSILLRKNLLRKLGYRIPPVMYLPKIRVQFKGEATLKVFLKNLSGTTLGEAARWVTNKIEDGTTVLEMQDVLAYQANEPFYNLSHGYLDAAGMIKGRRLLNSLSLPYSMVSVFETVNGYSWLPGKILNNFVLLNIDHPQVFSTPLDDAEWILKLIAKLTRRDYEEVVRMSYYPEDVGRLLIEKIISRRNWLLENFKIKNTAPMAFDEKISFGPELMNGELKKERWEGHAARYAYSDPESPLSSSEIRAFFKSKGLATALNALVAKFDNALFKGTDIEKEVFKRQYEAGKKQFENFLKTGEIKKIPFGLFAVPTIDGYAWTSRDVVMGEYLGTDNVIQLADTFEMAVMPGVFISAVGLPAYTDLQAGVQLKRSRGYTHLRSIKSIKRALKEPFKNLLVTILKQETGRIFDELLTQEYQALNTEEKEKKLAEIMSQFKEAMGTGDAFIISDNISTDSFGSIGYGLTENLKIQATLYATKRSIGRLQIVKRSDDELQVYRDNGDMAVKGFNLGLKAQIPILTIEFNKTKGDAATKFYSLDLTPKFKANPDVEKTLFGIRQLFIENSMELIRAQHQPYLVAHTFTEKTNSASFLTEKRFGQKSTDMISITHPKGQSKNFIRATEGLREGRDLQGLTIDTINALIAESLDSKDVSIPNKGSGNPGDTFKGQSSMRNAIFEAEVVGREQQSALHEPIVNIVYRWKGWKIKTNKMIELIRNINTKFNYEIFSTLEFGKAENFQLYSIDVSMYLYQEALEAIFNIPPDELRRILNTEADFTRAPYYNGSGGGEAGDQQDQFRQRVVAEILNHQRQFIEKQKRSNKKSALEHGVAFVSSLEILLPFDRFIEILGGNNNIFVFGRVTAFREGDENGDIPVVGNSMGRIGSERPRGGLAQAQSIMGITSSSLYLSWILRNL